MRLPGWQTETEKSPLKKRGLFLQEKMDGLFYGKEQKFRKNSWLSPLRPIKKSSIINKIKRDGSVWEKNRAEDREEGSGWNG